MPNKGKEKKTKKPKGATLSKETIKNVSTQALDAKRKTRFLFKKNFGVFFRLVSMLAVGGILWILVVLFLPLLQSPLATGVYSLDTIKESDPSRPTINLVFGEPDWSKGITPHVLSKINGKVELPQEPIWNNGGCFNSLRYWAIVEKSPYTQPTRYGRGSSPDTPLEPNLCFSVLNKKSYPTSIPNNIYGEDFTYISGRPPYFYPFDWGEIKLRIHLDGYENVGDQAELRRVLVNITGEVEAKNWDVKINVVDGFEQSYYTNEQIRSDTLVNIRYERPLVYKIIPMVLLITILLIIIYAPFIKEPSSFLEVLVGLIFGIWGIKQVIIPAFVTWTTILEPIILGLYMCLCISVFIKFVIMPLQAKIDKFSQGKNE